VRGSIAVESHDSRQTAPRVRGGTIVRTASAASDRLRRDRREPNEGISQAPASTSSQRAALAAHVRVHLDGGFYLATDPRTG